MYAQLREVDLEAELLIQDALDQAISLRAELLRAEPSRNEEAQRVSSEVIDLLSGEERGVNLAVTGPELHGSGEAMLRLGDEMRACELNDIWELVVGTDNLAETLLQAPTPHTRRHPGCTILTRTGTGRRGAAPARNASKTARG